jgi:hypothetical protein
MARGPTRKRSKAASSANLAYYTVAAYAHADDASPQGVFEILARSEDEALKLACRDPAAANYHRLIVKSPDSAGVIRFSDATRSEADGK